LTDPRVRPTEGRSGEAGRESFVGTPDGREHLSATPDSPDATVTSVWAE
jgi:hypothetical protein